MAASGRFQEGNLEGQGEVTWWTDDKLSEGWGQQYHLLGEDGSWIWLSQA
jgi:hypothetical protein